MFLGYSVFLQRIISFDFKVSELLGLYGQATYCQTRDHLLF